jgi:ornithine cyclodeaminase
MPGHQLTRFRTAALTVLAAQSGCQATHKLALFGAGHQGRAHLEALLHALPFKRVDVVDHDDVSAWCSQISERFGVAVSQVPAPQAIERANMVVTITRSKAPLFDGSLLHPGAFVVAVGTGLPNARELDDRTLSRAARVVVEWKPQSLQEAGEIVLGKASGALQDERIVDMQEIYAGKARWREATDEVVVFKTVGVGLTDLAAAALVWQHLGG